MSVVADSVMIAHKVLVYFMMLGFLLPKKYLIAHLMLWPAVISHWQFNDNKCILTEMELKLRGEEAKSIYDENGGEYVFMKKFMNDMGMEFNSKQLHNLIYIGFTVSWLISLYRYTGY